MHLSRLWIKEKMSYLHRSKKALIKLNTPHHTLSLPLVWSLQGTLPSHSPICRLPLPQGLGILQFWQPARSICHEPRVWGGIQRILKDRDHRDQSLLDPGLLVFTTYHLSLPGQVPRPSLSILKSKMEHQVIVVCEVLCVPMLKMTLSPVAFPIHDTQSIFTVCSAGSPSWLLEVPSPITFRQGNCSQRDCPKVRG